MFLRKLCLASVIRYWGVQYQQHGWGGTQATQGWGGNEVEDMPMTEGEDSF